MKTTGLTHELGDGLIALSFGHGWSASSRQTCTASGDECPDGGGRASGSGCLVAAEEDTVAARPSLTGPIVLDASPTRGRHAPRTAAKPYPSSFPRPRANTFLITNARKSRGAGSLGMHSSTSLRASTSTQVVSKDGYHHIAGLRNRTLRSN